MMNVAVMGYGTIGSGVVEIIETNQGILRQKTGEAIAVKYVLDLREFLGTSVEHKIIHNFSVIENDPEVTIVVETMGGLNPAYPFVKACLSAGKHVITSNKALVAAHGTELLEIAEKNQVNFFFEASVGGGIPIIRPMYQSLAGEQIEEITGILNGTTNYVLTKMDREGVAFESALKEAQDLGYAELNPAADVEGHDTCRKIAILTAMATGKEVNFEDIHTEGITSITDVDFQYAKKIGMSIKLLGSSRIQGTKVHAWVAPVLVGADHPLFAVQDVYNGIMVKGNMLGTVMFYGSGAGKLPTAAAVIADVIEAVNHKDSHISLGWTAKRQKIASMESMNCPMLVRLEGDPEQRRGEVEQIFGKVQIITLQDKDEFAVLTQNMTEMKWNQVSASLSGIRQMIRVELS